MSIPKRWAALVDEDNDSFPRNPVYLARFDEPTKCTSFAKLACCAVERRSFSRLWVIAGNRCGKRLRNIEKHRKM
jgi:hypothetical protein